MLHVAMETMITVDMWISYKSGVASCEINSAGKRRYKSNMRFSVG